MNPKYPYTVHADGFAQTGVELHRLGRRLCRLHYRIDGWLRDSQFFEGIPQRQEISADRSAAEPRFRAHGHERHRLRSQRTKSWVLRKNPTEKEQRFCKRLGLEIIMADCRDFLDYMMTKEAA